MDNIIDSGSYRGRRSLDIVVPELPLRECVKFWGRRAKRIDPREIIDILSVTGGVPRYLEEINPAETAEENIRRLFFSPNAVLRTDFDEMFSDVIPEEQSFTARVLRQLIDGPASAAEVTAKLGLEKGGRVSGAMTRLKEAGFVAVDNGINPETQERPRERRYRLCDNYARFYLKFVEPAKDVIDTGTFAFASLREFVNMDTVLGQAFENLVVCNYREIVPYLHLGGNLILSASPYRRHKTNGKNGRPGVQIDLLIQTQNTICVVEVKRKAKIDREIISEVDERLRCIKRPDGVSMRPVLVYDGELSPTVPSSGYFDAIISFCRLLGLE